MICFPYWSLDGGNSHVYAGKLSSVIFDHEDARVIIQGPKQLHMSTPEKKKDDLQTEEFSIEKISKTLKSILGLFWSSLGSILSE